MAKSPSLLEQAKQAQNPATKIAKFALQRPEAYLQVLELVKAYQAGQLPQHSAQSLHQLIRRQYPDFIGVTAFRTYMGEMTSGTEAPAQESANQSARSRATTRRPRRAR